MPIVPIVSPVAMGLNDISSYRDVQCVVTLVNCILFEMWSCPASEYNNNGVNM